MPRHGIRVSERSIGCLVSGRQRIFGIYFDVRRHARTVAHPAKVGLAGNDDGSQLDWSRRRLDIKTARANYAMISGDYYLIEKFVTFEYVIEIQISHVGSFHGSRVIFRHPRNRSFLRDLPVAIATFCAYMPDMQPTETTSLASWRARMKWSKAKAARELGISRNSYSAYETGAAPIPVAVLLACKSLLLGEPPIR